MARILKTLLLWIVMLALPLRGMAAIDTSCGRVSEAASAIASAAFVDAHAGDSAHAHEHADHDGGNSAKDSSTADCADGTPHKTSTCSGGICHIGAAAPPLSINLATLLEHTEVAHNPPPVSFAVTVPASLERPPRHLPG